MPSHFITKSEKALDSSLIFLLPTLTWVIFLFKAQWSQWYVNCQHLKSTMLLFQPSNFRSVLYHNVFSLCGTSPIFQRIMNGIISNTENAPPRAHWEHTTTRTLRTHHHAHTENTPPRAHWEHTTTRTLRTHHHAHTENTPPRAHWEHTTTHTHIPFCLNEHCTAY